MHRAAAAGETAPQFSFALIFPIDGAMSISSAIPARPLPGVMTLLLSSAVRPGAGARGTRLALAFGVVAPQGRAPLSTQPVR